MYEEILVPLDASQSAEVALPYAEELSGRLGSQVTLVYVSESTEDPNQRVHQFYLEKMVDATREGADRYHQRSWMRPIKVNSIILVGNPAEKIVEYADEEDVGLIVIATHGRSGIKRWALGSVADKVVKGTSRPVALIRAKGARPDVREKGILNKVLVPLDGSKEAEVVIPYVEELASKLKAEILLLQAVARGYQPLSEYTALTERQFKSDKATTEDYLNNIAAQLKKKGMVVTTEVRPIVQEGRAADEIIDFASQIRADFVAMSTHGRSGVRRWVFGSVAERVLREGNTPLLLVKVAPSP